MSVTAETVASLLAEQKAALVADFERLLADRLASASAAAKPASGKSAAAKKPKDPDAPKKEPNDWIKFVSRVRSVVKEFVAATLPTLEGEENKEAREALQTKSAASTVPMFASHLKAENADFASWEDEAIIASFDAWERPAVSKQEAAGLNKRKGASGAASGAASAAASAEASDAEEGEEAKPKRKWSEEAKASAAAKRAAKKAAASGGASGGAGAAPAAEKPKISIKPKTSAAPAVSLKFRSWSHGGQDYFKNGRGDVISTDFDWVGRYSLETDSIDEGVEMPADLESPEME